MTKTKSPKPAEPRITAPTSNGVSAKDRLQACFDELKVLLERHGCQIVPGISPPVPVGYDGTYQRTPTWSLAVVPDDAGEAK